MHAVALPAAAQETRLALVIGVASYTDRNVPKLDNTLNDSRALARSLREHGFTVREVADPSRREMMAAINAFAADLPRARVGLFYFAGHGVQLNGANYLLPRDIALVNRREDLADESVGVTDVATRMTGANAEAFHLLIIDACRDDPFKSASRGLLSGRGLTTQSASGVMILQAAGSNQIALDGGGTGDSNGLFTGELLKAIRIPGLPVRGVIQTVRDAVRLRAASLGGKQTPALYDEAVGDFVFTPGGPGTPEFRPQIATTIPPPPPPPPSQATLPSLTQPDPAFPSEAEIAAAYEANKSRLQLPRQYRLAQIALLLPANASKEMDEEAHRKILDLRQQALKPRADFAELARKSSQDRASAEHGGEVGWVRDDALLPVIRDAVAGLAENAISEVVRAPDAWHVVKLLGTRPPGTATLAEARDGLVRALRQARAQQAARAYLDGLLTQEPIQINEIDLARRVAAPR